MEKLKEKARAEEGTAKVLRGKLGEAERRIKELRAQGGRDVVRRLMDEVCNNRRRSNCWCRTGQSDNCLDPASKVKHVDDFDKCDR